MGTNMHPLKCVSTGEAAPVAGGTKAGLLVLRAAL